jgi:hypothetical protein
MRRTIQNISFANELGKTLPPPRNAASKLGYLNKYQMISDFRSAPASNLGGGLGVSFRTIDLTGSETTPTDILSAVKHNFSVLRAQGTLTKEQHPVFLRQVNSLSKDSYGGDTIALQEAQKHYHNIIATKLGNLAPPGNLGGLFSYDNNQESLPNGVRLLGSLAMYLVIPTIALYYFANSKAVKARTALIAAAAAGGSP